MKQKVGSSIRINNIDQPISKLTKRERHQINNIRSEKNIRTGTEEILTMTWTHFSNLLSTKLENLIKIDNFLNTYHLPKFNQDKTEI